VNLIDGTKQTKDNIQAQWDALKEKKFHVEVKKVGHSIAGALAFASSLDFNFIPHAGHLTVGEYAIDISDEADPTVILYSAAATVKAPSPVRLTFKWGKKGEEKACSLLMTSEDFLIELRNLAIESFPKLSTRSFDLGLFIGLDLAPVPLRSSRDVFQLSNDSVILILKL
jgi:hypothetical protein